MSTGCGGLPAKHPRHGPPGPRSPACAARAIRAQTRFPVGGDEGRQTDSTKQPCWGEDIGGMREGEMEVFALDVLATETGWVVASQLSGRELDW